MKIDSNLILIPSKKKIFLYSLLFLILASTCFFIELITNKITQGTQLIRFYESIVFYLLASYYLVQLIPGYAKLIIDNHGFREIWFFRERVKVLWSMLDIAKCKQLKAGDTLYIQTDNEHVFSKKMACKGCYHRTDKQLYHQFIQQLKPLSANNKGSSRYLLLGQMRLVLIVVFSFMVIAFNGYYLNNENPDPEFIEQVSLWTKNSQGLSQQQLDKQLFESFKVYGFYWKKQLKQFDRNLFHQVLLQESIQIEKALLKRKQVNEVMLEPEKSQFLQQLAQCKNNYLFHDEIKYLQCLEKL